MTPQQTATKPPLNSPNTPLTTLMPTPISANRHAQRYSASSP